MAADITTELSGFGDGSDTVGGIFLEGPKVSRKRHEAEQPQATFFNSGSTVGIFSICGGLWGSGYVGLGLNVLDI